MSAMEPLAQLFATNSKNFSKREQSLLEADLFITVCHELKNFFRQQYQSYFRLMKFKKDKENTMLEEDFVPLIIRDILSTNEYTLQGIAYYTNTPEEIVHEVVLGRNCNPSVGFVRRVIELHRHVRKELYRELRKKMVKEGE